MVMFCCHPCRAAEEVERVQKSSASDIARLEAALRKAELQVEGLESTVELKVSVFLLSLIALRG
jgi:hypothetical protein